jgi:hypothetical protein
MGVAMLHVPTPSQTKYAQRHRDFHASISARASSITPQVNAPYVPRYHAINPVPYWRQMWFYGLVCFGETYVPGPTRTKRVDIRKIQEIVAKHYDVKLSDILSNRRTADVIMPRHVAMYLAKELTGKSLPELGKRFAGRDHTTILSAIQKITRMIKIYPELATTVAAISLSIKDETV